MNGYTDCTQAQRDQAKAVAATYGASGASLAQVAEANGYHPYPAATPGLVALCIGTTRIRAGIIVKGTKTRAYVLYYVQSTDRYYITTVDLAHLYVVYPASSETWDQYHGRAQVANVLDTLAAKAPKAEEAPATEEAMVQVTDVTLTESGKAKVEAHLMDRGLIPPRKVESLLNPLDAESFRTGNLAEDVEAWLTSKGYGKK